MPERTLRLAPGAPAAIQRVPEGLLGFLQLKNGGKFPQHLGSQELRASLELFQWYMETNDEFLALTPKTANAVGTLNFPEWSVPSSEYWYVISMAILTFTGVGEAIKCQLQVFDGGTIPSVTSSRFSQVVSIAASDQIGFSFGGFFMRPNTTPALLVGTITGTVDVQGCLHFVRLPV